MASMSFMDEVKDKASRIIPSAYSEIVEETTSDVLLAPNYQNIVFICDSANANHENVTDIVRAIRRRMDNKSAKVQYFTVQVLDSLIKNCGLNVHVEVAETKGLLHDLFVIATRKPSRDGEREACTAALTLILNMSLWFSGHPDDRLKVLMELADHVRKSCGPNVFEGIEPDVTVQLKRTSGAATSAAKQQAAVARRQRRQEAEYLRLQQEYALAASQQHHQQVVKAIPLVIPTDEEISGMLDACLVLAECLNTAESQGSPIIGDELISNVATQIRRDHRNIAMILSSGAEISNMDVLLSVTDTQTTIIQRLSDSVKAERAQRGGNEHSTAADNSRQSSEDFQHNQAAASTAPPLPGTESSHVAHSVTQPPQQHTGGEQRHIRQAQDVEDYEDVEMQTTPKIPAASTAVPTMDDLFGNTTATSSSSIPPPTATTPFPQPSQSVDHLVGTPAAMSHHECGTVVQPQTGHSLNHDDEGDEFDNFLNSRLRK
jgi:hypothetical protein